MYKYYMCDTHRVMCNTLQSFTTGKPMFRGVYKGWRHYGQKGGGIEGRVAALWEGTHKYNVKMIEPLLGFIVK